MVFIMELYIGYPRFHHFWSPRLPAVVLSSSGARISLAAQMSLDF
jgi:hypothetical protein